MRFLFPSHVLVFAAALAAAGCHPAQQSASPDPRVVSEMNRGVSLMGQYAYSNAVEAFQSVLQVAPDLTDARINLAIAQFNRNRKEDIEAAEKQLMEVLAKEPQNIRALYFNAIVLQHVGKAEDAVRCLEHVVRTRPDDGAAWYLLGLCKQRANQPAEPEFLKAVQSRPYLYSAYYQLYQIAMRAGNTEKGAEYLERFKALRESPLGESIELPQYNQMGELALTLPLPRSHPPAIARSQYGIKTGKSVLTWPAEASPAAQASLGAGAAAADFNRDGLIDLVIPGGPAGALAVLVQNRSHEFSDETTRAGLDHITNALSCAMGDVDNDGATDLAVTSENGLRLFKGKGDATFTEITPQAGMDSTGISPRSALFLDADHDGDLDLFVCGRAGNHLWNNNGNGSFTNIASQAAIGLGKGSVMVLPGDLDGDRDQDLIVLRQDQTTQVFRNELLGQYAELDLHGMELSGGLGGALQDFNGDGILDLLLLGGSPVGLRFFTGDGHGGFRADSQFNAVSEAASSHGPLRGFRVADIDLDGDLDIVAYSSQVHLLLNDGSAHFVLRAGVWKPSGAETLSAVEVLDLTGDLVPDLLIIERGASNRVSVFPGELSPPSTALAIWPTGLRGRDGRTRSPASGYGANLTSRFGLREQRFMYTGQSGSFNQSAAPLVLGLDGAAKADYVSLLWPDGVAQVEMALASGQIHTLEELQRKISSCPVLFSWNGTRFQFVTDFAGVGGLGYLAAPGSYAAPQVLEHVKIEPDQLKPRDGVYELRVTEPMEETAYVDQLELLAIDHPAGLQVFPDERLAISGPAPTHALLVLDAPVFPVHALAPSGRECAPNLTQADRLYAYTPKLDRRYIGFCEPHTLELDFGDAFEPVDGTNRVFLFVNGSIEYPYSQTVYAASQSHVGWEPIRVQRQEKDGTWTTIVADAGAPGGMGRTMTIDLTEQLRPSTRKLRLTTNLEILYDQIFVARILSEDKVTVRPVPLGDAQLRAAGFPREFSPDGRLPLIYDYEQRDATAPFHSLKGAYTRYGAVQQLLREFDDCFVLVGPGDEIALQFDARSLGAPQAGQTRSFILVSHAYCKDMDLYTATPQTLEPLPFRGMSRYPYPATEQYPTSAVHQAFQRTYNTRIVR